ncbi:Abscisic acid 8'-hydroxylase 3 [Apostasia shenzhenica]|uniref:Abscisic acid 8'-hydroxylase 3 n=1 Tax=Apostasia shenzhenica TaxID=1088818 RepID=A0A2I0AIS8_9ASPA|nr:Abscisic acid 8'-hydroxylase 3 [Apostasia shenzhenica]
MASVESISCSSTFIFVFLAVFSFILMKKCAKKKPLRLPPGSMGWPYAGETFQLYSQDPNFFFSSRQKRYGEIFKTRLLGCRCVMLASPEAARFVLVSQAGMFKPTYPPSKEKMIGPWALFFHEGDYHARLRKLVQASLAPEALRRLVPGIEAAAASALSSWQEGRVVSTFHAMKKLSFDVGILAIFGGRLDERRKKELRKNYFMVDRGYNSFPMNLPGTHYSKAVKGRKRLGEILSDIVSERRENGDAVENKDLLSSFEEWRSDEGEKLTDNQISDNIIGVLFAAQDTTASALTWIIKYLHDHPKLLEAVKVILESLRMASIISFTFREAVADVEYKGYLIPKGWKVMPLFRNIHHNPNFFSKPHEFDPSRFEVSPKPNTFLPFGNGVHSCPGNELAKLEMLIFIHHLVTKYKFEVVGSNGEVEYSPFPVPKHGLPVRLWAAEQAAGSGGAACRKHPTA